MEDDIKRLLLTSQMLLLTEAVSDLPEVSTDLSVLFTDHPEAWILKMKLDNSSAALFLNTLKVSNNLGC